MLDGDRERQEENRGRQREEWRVEKGVSRGGPNAKRWPTKAWNGSPSDCQNQVLEVVVYEVVMVEESEAGGTG
jgi:hypothetical protein